MSGLNIAKLNNASGGFESMPMKEQQAHILQFCDKHPDKTYLYAVIDLYTTIYPKDDKK